MIEKLMSDKERERYIANVERIFRKESEVALKRMKKSLDSLLRGEFPTVATTKAKNKLIIVAITSRELGIPLFRQDYEVDWNFNEQAFAQSLSESYKNFFLSNQFKEIQKKMYYRLKEKGVKDTEIYCQIEPRYSDMDSAEKTNFRKNLSRWYGRKKATKKGDKTDKVSPRSKS